MNLFNRNQKNWTRFDEQWWIDSFENELIVHENSIDDAQATLDTALEAILKNDKSKSESVAELDYKDRKSK